MSDLSSRYSSRALGGLLEDISVMEYGMWENDLGPKGWYAVCGSEGIIAYFQDSADAFRFRLDYINRILNP
jgi:hypothetical protein